VAVGIGLVGLGLIAGLRHHKSSGIDDHISALARLRYPPTAIGPRGWFSSEYLLWNLQGRLSYSQVNQRKDDHRESLVALGYLQRRTFILENRKLEDPMELQRLQQLHRQACEAAGLGAPLVSCTTDWSNRVTIVARPREVSVLAEVLRGFDATNSPPDPQSGANGRQSLSSETNRTPAAAASRRSP
jgi:hypothetical protein